MTINMSRSGALIRVVPNGYPTPLLQPGDVLWAEVPLPAHRMFKQRCLACKAVAVRMSAEEDALVVALRFEQVQFGVVKAAAATANSLAVM